MRAFTPLPLTQESRIGKAPLYYQVRLSLIA